MRDWVRTAIILSIAPWGLLGVGTYLPMRPFFNSKKMDDPLEIARIYFMGPLWVACKISSVISSFKNRKMEQEKREKATDKFERSLDKSLGQISSIVTDMSDDGAKRQLKILKRDINLVKIHHRDTSKPSHSESAASNKVKWGSSSLTAIEELRCVALQHRDAILSEDFPRDVLIKSLDTLESLINSYRSKVR